MDVVMPQLGETVAEGTVSAWFKSPGERVEVGENLFEIETDKVTMEVQALSSGTLSEIRVKTGETAPVGAVVAVIGESAAEARTGAPDKVPSGAAANGASSPAGLEPFGEVRTPLENFGRADGPEGVKITPLARRLLAQNGLDVEAVARSVRARGGSRIGKAEVAAALRDGAAPARPALPASGAPAVAPAPAAAPLAARAPSREPAAGEVVPFNAVRRRTAERLAEAWRTVPHVVQAVEVDFAAVERVRAAKKTAFTERHGVGLTYLPFIARAVAIAVGDFPRVNARLEGDGLALSRDLHLGVAVDLDHEGLVVPVMREAGELTVTGLAKAIHRLVEKARAGRLAPDDMAGGTYTISNNGSFGTLFTAPIVNPPQVAILSTDAVRKRPVVVESAAGDAIAIRPVGVLAQSFDHRAFDGAYSAAFLARLKDVLETRNWDAELS